MSQKRAKNERAFCSYLYQKALAVWKQMEPSKWRFISHRRWKKRKPIPPKICKKIVNEEDNT